MPPSSSLLTHSLKHSRQLCRAFAFACFFWICRPADAAVVFNWPDAGWTAGAPAAGATATQNFSNFSPNDITVSLYNGGGPGTIWQPGYPQINTTASTGGFTGIDAMQLYMTAQDSTAAYIRTTISFATPA